MTSNYVCGAVGQINTNLKRSNIDHTVLNKLLTDNCNKFMDSFGVSGEKIFRLFNKLKEMEYFKNCQLWLDSGGFQIIKGTIDNKRIRNLLDTYYESLKDNYDSFDRAFTLDIPLGIGTSKYFNSPEEVYRETERSYLKAQSLNSDKMICIHQSALWDFYNKMFIENKFINSFKYFASGGLVMGRLSTYCRPYVTSVVILLTECIKENKTKLDLHILGLASPLEVLTFKLIELHVKKLYNIDINITYDTAIAISVNKGRAFYVVGEDSVHMMGFSSTDFARVDLTNKRDIFFREIKKLEKYDIYLEEFDMKEDKSLFEVYSTLYVIYAAGEIESLMTRKANEIYTLIDEPEKLIKGIKRVNIDSSDDLACSIEKSLEMITKLDLDFCKHVVDRYFKLGTMKQTCDI